MPEQMKLNMKIIVDSTERNMVTSAVDQNEYVETGRARMRKLGRVDGEKEKSALLWLRREREMEALIMHADEMMSLRAQASHHESSSLSSLPT
jgi:hypothetical protein